MATFFDRLALEVTSPHTESQRTAPPPLPMNTRHPAGTTDRSSSAHQQSSIYKAYAEEIETLYA